MSAQLFETPGNPIPEGARVDMLAMSDGKRLRYARFPALAQPLKGTVVIIHGRNEYIEKYFETIGDLARRGFEVAAFDLRGQGGSDRLLRDPWRGHATSFTHHVSDLERFLAEIVLPDCRGPYYVLAHSTGALVALMAMPMLVNQVQRMVLNTPLLSFARQGLSMNTARRVSGAMSFIGLGRSYMGRGAPGKLAPFATNKVTGDEARYERNCEIYRQHPELGVGGPTAAWVHAVCKAIDQVKEPDFVGGIRLPTLFIAAGADTVVSTQEIEAYSRRVRSGALLTIDGARHEILQERDLYREQFLAAFDAFIPGSE
ncbi:alpha/beta hydrolase [Aquamicrobium sp. LC103]|uniref:alpha/beta fold hydrolase n=1 Tax=Aquamicrobium sp. LC103 TaxID=1120658 RepID=UPI00063EB820|nr:alpha/beta hydrolase [Aquamicrobium sp. LC103]TKT77549.1 alpha/beta hydrolase [Aquamicrobium sp. LC103]